jgi:DNA ligase-associated metallophosphoesterase
MTEFAGQSFELLADRAVWWPARRALIVADLHLGKAASFRAGGVPVPAGTTGHDLARLSMLIGMCDARELLILGDFLHARAGHDDQLTAQLQSWRSAHESLAITLIRGNHDRHAGDPDSSLRIDVVAEPFHLNGIELVHDPEHPTRHPCIGGHIHPGVRLHDFDGAGVTVPAFVVEDRRMILPAFGRFTGCVAVRPGTGRRLLACAADRVVPVAASAATK